MKTLLKNCAELLELTIHHQGQDITEAPRAVPCAAQTPQAARRGEGIASVHSQAVTSRQ